MAIKNLKPVPALFPIPEGLSFLPVALLLYQKSSDEIWANPAFETEFGKIYPNRFPNVSGLGLIHQRPMSLSLFNQLGRHEGYVIECKDGLKVPIEIKVTQYAKELDEIFLILIEDVREKADLENQLIQKHIELQHAFQEVKTAQNAVIQSAKLASLGEMSTGIAHELNQPLQAILGFSQELEHSEALSDQGKEFLGDIVSGAKKMAEIIRSLRSFARQSGEDYVETSIADVIDEARRLMYHSLLQKGIEFDIKIDNSLPFILANPIQLEQVFVNFFSNARDAIESAKKSNGIISVNASVTNFGIEVSVRDDGCGMSREIQEKIFDPFFTTKEVGKGTGLGLSISYGILQKLKAEIEVISSANQGTEFKIRFPLGKANAA